KHIIRHLMEAFAALGAPLTIKTDNGPAYTSTTLKNLSKMGHSACFCVPHSPMGQAIVERSHAT
ncbi:POK7 protein, partial [Thinocorus orbignyianus]|nr:POK7 protein [Thinocorus orbignyianus]